MKTLIAIAASLLAATVITASPPPARHQPTFQERFGDWDRTGRIQSNACQPRWPTWQIMCE